MRDLDSIPKKLGRDTIYETVFEMRFSSRQPNISSILPGMLYAKLGTDFPKSEVLPFGSMPAALLSQNDLFAYQPTHALIGEKMKLMIGQRSMSLSLTRPYPGWPAFQDLIVQCVGALLSTTLIAVIERCSLKYTNLVAEGRDAKDLSQLEINVHLNGIAISTVPTAIKTEIAHRGCSVIIQVMSGATVRLPGTEGNSGVLVDVDTIKAGPFRDFAAELPGLLDVIHTTEKQVFFSLLTDDTLNKLEPAW